MDFVRNIFPCLNTISERWSNRRSGGRVSTIGLRSCRGRVVDLSKSGLRLATRLPWREGDEREVVLSGSSLGVRLRARCVWVRREGMFSYVVGLAFQHVNDEQAIGLSELARAHSARLEHENAARQRDSGDGADTQAA